MKKIWISVCVFAVIAFSFTGVLIYLNNAKISKENKNDELNNGEEFYEDNHTNDYKLATTEEITFESGEVFKENAIIIEDIPLTGISEGNIFQIKGLKDEKVQDRINNDIKNKVNIKISDISKEENFKSFKSIAYDITANFSNVISAYVDIKYMQKDDSENKQYVYLNYELVNGNRLKLSDLLKKDTEITDLVRKDLYKNEMGYNEWWADPDVYFDREKGVWREEGWSWDFENRSEQGINKMMLKFEKMNKENEFCISSYAEFIPDIYDVSEIYTIPVISIPEIAYLDVGELPGKVTVFKKYLTSESLYKDDTMAEKNKISNMLKIIVDKKNSDLLADNFYYKRAETYFGVALDESGDLDIYDNGIAKYSINDNLKKVDDKYIKWFFDEVEKCKEIALKDPNNFYAIISTSRFLGYETSNTFKAEMGLYKIVVPIERKNEIIETIYDVCLNYGRENDLFWDYRELRVADFGNKVRNAYSDKLIELSTEHLVFLSGLYDVRTLQPVESITEHDEKDFNVVYVLPGSDKVKITKSDIENFSLDELNKAYNEIFARHGHDFTNKELKDFFWGMIWYTPISGKTVSLDELSEVEKYNLNIIKEVIAKKKK